MSKKRCSLERERGREIEREIERVGEYNEKDLETVRDSSSKMGKVERRGNGVVSSKRKR